MIHARMGLAASSVLLAMGLAQGCGSKHDGAAAPDTSGADAMAAAPAGTAAPTQLLKSGTIDWQADDITLPLYQGATADGKSVWYVITDVDDAATAATLGVDYSPAIANAAKAASTRTATVNADGTWLISGGAIDFSPKHTIVPGAAPNFFPPQTATPGSVGDAKYSPFITVAGHVYNAPVLAYNVDAAQIDFCDGKPNYDLVHDKVLKLCPVQKTVTLPLTHGFAGGKEVVYLSFDSNVGLPATLEASTLAAAESDLEGLGVSINLYAVVNGATGATNADRQGLDSALSGEGSPLNILSGLPTSAGYSPLWDIHMTVWTDAAVAAGDRHRLKSAADVQTASTAGYLTGPAGAPIGSAGLLVNCPVVAVLN